MVKIEILGPGCVNCRRAEANAREAVAMTGVDARVVMVTDYRAILRYGVVRNPGLAIDGTLVSAGRVPSADDIAIWLTQDPAPGAGQPAARADESSSASTAPAGGTLSGRDPA